MPRHLIAEEGPFAGLILNLEEGEEWIIGRDPDQAQFILEDKKVSRKHALCFRSPDGTYIRNLSQTNPIEVNDRAATEDVLLKDGDRVRIGESVFLFSSEELPSEFQEVGVEEPLIIPKEASIEEKTFEEEELSFSLPSENKFLLKVTSGPNAGAEFGMELGKSYIIGKDPQNSDIVFHDLSVSKRHAKININLQGHLTIEDLGSKNRTLVNAMPIDGVKVLASHDLVTLGTTSFLIIDQEASVQTIYTPLPPQPKEEVKIEKKEKKEAIDWKKEKIPGRYLILAAGICFIFFLGFFSFFSLFKSESIDIAQKDVGKDLGKLFHQYEDIRYSYNPGSASLFVTGHVLNSIDLQEINYRLKQLSFIEKIDNRIIIDEYVWKNMNDVLGTNEKFRGISIHSPKAGLFVMNGYVKTPEELEELADYININFPYADRLENQVVIENILNIQIANNLFAQGFGAIGFQLLNGEVILSGLYSEEETGKFSNLLDNIRKLKGIRSIKNLTLKAGPDMARIDLTSKYQVSGIATKDRNSFSIIVNDQVVTMGSKLDGMVITEIKPNVILLEKDRIKYKIQYNE